MGPRSRQPLFRNHSYLPPAVPRSLFFFGALATLVLRRHRFLTPWLGPCPTTSDWPGKISGRRSPFAFMSDAVVVWYALAIPPSVSPDFTMWVAPPRVDDP